MEVAEECGGEAERCMEGENPPGRGLLVWSSAFLLTPERWAPAPDADPIIGHNLV